MQGKAEYDRWAWIVSYGLRNYAIRIRPCRAIGFTTLNYVVRRNDEIEAEWGRYSQRFATSLRSARDRAGLSQEDVAYQAGLTRYTYQKYEKGESRPGAPANPSLRTLIALSQVLDVPIEELLPTPLPDLRNR